MPEAQTEKKKKKKKNEEDWEEPKIKWKRSKAKALLEKDILEGRVPREAKDEKGRSTRKLRDIYDSRPEFAEYHYSKFSSRLSGLRKTVTESLNRAVIDQDAFNNYTQNHPAKALFSHKGYIQWQGSEAQALCVQDLEANRHKTMSRNDLYGSRAEYYENFPLDVFRFKLNQEIRTAKYLHTLEVKGKDPRKKK